MEVNRRALSGAVSLPALFWRPSTSSTRSGPSGVAGSKASPNCNKCLPKLENEHECCRIAFPANSTGIFGYPLKTSTEAALNRVEEQLEAILGTSGWVFSVLQRGNAGGVSETQSE
jgi:O-acetyl-ADP-ribose deacetylase (regulator of RNase III)